MDLTLQRCFNHPHREAAARCPECGRFFCRECVTEHENQVLCSICLAGRVAPKKTRRRPFAVAVQAGQTVFGLWVAWIFFYYLGKILLGLPSSFHDGTLWEKTWW